MARRMAGTDSAFTIGLRVGQEVGGMIAKTATVLEDRANQKKAEQVELEYNKRLEEIKAPWTEVQERARATAKKYSDAGTDMPMEEARALQQEIRTKKVAYLTDQLDLAMTLSGANLGNKYVQERFKTVVDGTLTQLQATSAVAQRELAQQQWEFQQERADVSDAQSQMEMVERGAMREQSERQFNRAEAGRNERARMAAGGKQTPLSFNDVIAMGEMAKQEAKSRPPEFWTERLKEDGLEDNPTTRANVMNQYVFERTIEGLSGKYSPEQLAAVPKPTTFAVPPDPDEEFVRVTRASGERMLQSPDPKRRQRGQFMLEAAAEAERALQKERAVTPEDREDDLNYNEVAGRSAEGWWNKITSMAEGGGLPGGPGEFGYGPQRGPKRAGGNPAPGGDDWTGQAQEFNRETGQWEDAPREVGAEYEPPVGAVLQDQVEWDITEDPSMQNILTPEERKRYLDVRRVE